MAKALVTPKLSLDLNDPRTQIALEEISQYSITPRTFESRVTYSSTGPASPRNSE